MFVGNVFTTGVCTASRCELSIVLFVVLLSKNAHSNSYGMKYQFTSTGSKSDDYSSKSIGGIRVSKTLRSLGTLFTVKGGMGMTISVTSYRKYKTGK